MPLRTRAVPFGPPSRNEGPAVPAIRSRTENWRSCLRGVYERGGALEITLPGKESGSLEQVADSASLIWRVRILQLTDTEIVVEQPSALGTPITLHPGVELVAIMAVGQNRWMFRTTILSATQFSVMGSRAVVGYKLRLPADVERCQRRSFYRVSTVGLTLPTVECYPLLSLDSAIIAEAANRRDLMESLDSRKPAADERPVMPEVGPGVQTTLVNIGGGGAGLLLEPTDRGALESTPYFWMRVHLQPDLPAPLAVSARLKHTHIDSSQRVYAGMAFEFGHHPQHQKFVVEQLLRCVSAMQGRQDRLAAA
jgi:hypothetical protein